MDGAMIIFVDIDETICKNSEDRDYSKAYPLPDRISKINDLYHKGDTVIYWTARGSQTGIDWSDVTKEQFKKWGVECNDIMFGKPHYDLFIDDKNINSEMFFKGE